MIIDRATGDTTDEVRIVTLNGIGARWAEADLGSPGATARGVFRTTRRQNVARRGFAVFTWGCDVVRST